MVPLFEDFDFTDFWKDSEYYEREYTDDPLTAEKLAAVEQALGYKLPRAYIELAQRKNGGAPKRTNHRMRERTTWSHDHIAITGIYSIGSMKPCSLCGHFGSKFWVEEWGYPEIGVYFADCPSGGHDMMCLDYRDCGSTGDPKVVHVDQEWDYKITLVAKSFESFIRGLEDDNAFK